MSLIAKRRPESRHAPSTCTPTTYASPPASYSRGRRTCVSRLAIRTLASPAGNERDPRIWRLAGSIAAAATTSPSGDLREPCPGARDDRSLSNWLGAVRVGIARAVAAAERFPLAVAAARAGGKVLGGADGERLAASGAAVGACGRVAAGWNRLGHLDALLVFWCLAPRLREVGVALVSASCDAGSSGVSDAEETAVGPAGAGASVDSLCDAASPSGSPAASLENADLSRSRWVTSNTAPPITATTVMTFRPRRLGSGLRRRRAYEALRTEMAACCRLA